MPESNGFNIFDYKDIAEIALKVIGAIVILYAFVAYFLRKEIRLFLNLRRPIFFIIPKKGGSKVPAKEMEMEIDAIKKNGFFKVSTEVNDYQAFSPQKKYGLVVLGYDREMDGFDEIMSKVKQIQCPLIVYTYGKNTGEIMPEHLAVLNGYPWALISNFKLTLVNSVFTTLATFSYDSTK